MVCMFIGIVYAGYEIYNMTQITIEEGMTQAKIAEEINTSPQYISRLIKNNDKIVNQTFIRVMETLGYDVQLTYEKKKG